MSYYKDQLSKINYLTDFNPTFKITDSDGYSTFWIDINRESLIALRDFITEIETVRTLQKYYK